MMSLGAYTFYQWLVYGWFCVGAGIVAFFSFRDIICMEKDARKAKKAAKQKEAKTVRKMPENVPVYTHAEA